jgi:hypothetical protein
VRVFVSSVRHGLEEERDALPGLITAIGHTPVRFEDFTAQTTPSRQACLDGLTTADVYLLILGPRYGHRFDDTGQSPTHDEWTAASKAGLPRLVYRKQGVTFEDDQQAFARHVSEYTSGVFHDTFITTHELQAKVAAKLRELEHAPNPLAYSPLTAPVSLTWRSDFDAAARSRTTSRPELEIHVLPIGSAPRSARIMGELAQSLPNRIRDNGSIDASQPLHPIRTHEAIVITVSPKVSHHTGWNEVRQPQLLGIRVAADGQVSAWATLPGDSMGSILDVDALPDQIAGLLRLIGQLRIVDTPQLAIGVGINSTMSLSIGTITRLPRQSASFASLSDSPLQVPPDEQVTIAALDGGALEVAQVLTGSLIHALELHR